MDQPRERCLQADTDGGLKIAEPGLQFRGQRSSNRRMYEPNVVDVALEAPSLVVVTLNHLRLAVWRRSTDADTVRRSSEVTKSVYERHGKVSSFNIVTARQVIGPGDRMVVRETLAEVAPLCLHIIIVVPGDHLKAKLTRGTMRMLVSMANTNPPYSVHSSFKAGAEAAIQCSPADKRPSMADWVRVLDVARERGLGDADDLDAA